MAQTCMSNKEQAEPNLQHGSTDLCLAENYEFSSDFSTVGETVGAENLELACGYRFSPYGHELIVHYLLKKVLALKLPANIIREIDLYNYDPDQLPIGEFKFGKPNEAFFFTQIERRYSTRMARRTSNHGYWKATGREKPVFNNRNLKVGFKKIMVFYWGSGEKTSWVMHEYRLNPELVSAFELNYSLKYKIQNYVVCRIQLKN